MTDQDHNMLTQTDNSDKTATSGVDPVASPELSRARGDSPRESAERSSSNESSKKSTSPYAPPAIDVMKRLSDPERPDSGGAGRSTKLVETSASRFDSNPPSLNLERVTAVPRIETPPARIKTLDHKIENLAPRIETPDHKIDNQASLIETSDHKINIQAPRIQTPSARIDSNRLSPNLERVTAVPRVETIAPRIDPLQPSPRVEPLASSAEPRRVSAFLERSSGFAAAAEPIDRAPRSQPIEIPAVKNALNSSVVAAIDSAVVRPEPVVRDASSRIEERRRVWAEGWNAAAAEREARQNWKERSAIVPPAASAKTAPHSYAAPISASPRTRTVAAPTIDPLYKYAAEPRIPDPNRQIDIPLSIHSTPTGTINTDIDKLLYLSKVESIGAAPPDVESRRNTRENELDLEDRAIEAPNVADRRADPSVDSAKSEADRAASRKARKSTGEIGDGRAAARNSERAATRVSESIDSESIDSKPGGRASKFGEDRRSISSEYKQSFQQNDFAGSVRSGASDRGRSRDAAKEVDRDQAEGGADEFWPSAREIFRVNEAARSTGTNRLAVATKPRVDTRSSIVVDLTVPRVPQGISMRFGAIKYVSVLMLISGLGVVTTGISWIWARDDAAAERVAERLFDTRDKGSVASESDPSHGLLVPEGGWGRTTPRHLLIWAMAVDRGIASAGGDAREKTRELLERAKHASPAFAALRYAAVWRGRRDSEPTATSALALGRDVDALALTARRLLESGREEAAIAEMNRAIELAGKLDYSFEIEPPAAERRPGARVYQPREWIIERVLRDWSEACAERRIEATKAIPDLPVAWLAAARVASERNDSAEVQTALERAIETAGAVRSRETDRAELALSFAAEAEAEARLGRLEPARAAFSKAIDLTHVLNHQRAWWLEVAEIDVELGDTAAARKAIKFARDVDRDDRIARKAMELSARVAPAPPKDSSLIRTSTNSRY
jgi:tetratricopeptide (TPR) repeat protein